MPPAPAAPRQRGLLFPFPTPPAPLAPPGRAPAPAAPRQRGFLFPFPTPPAGPVVPPAILLQSRRPAVARVHFPRTASQLLRGNRRVRAPPRPASCAMRRSGMPAAGPVSAAALEPDAPSCATATLPRPADPTRRRQPPAHPHGPPAAIPAIRQAAARGCPRRADGADPHADTRIPRLRRHRTTPARSAPALRQRAPCNHASPAARRGSQSRNNASPLPPVPVPPDGVATAAQTSQTTARCDASASRRPRRDRATRTPVSAPRSSAPAPAATKATLGTGGDLSRPIAQLRRTPRAAVPPGRPRTPAGWRFPATRRAVPVGRPNWCPARRTDARASPRRDGSPRTRPGCQPPPRSGCCPARRHAAPAIRSMPRCRCGACPAPAMPGISLASSCAPAARLPTDVAAHHVHSSPNRSRARRIGLPISRCNTRNRSPSRDSGGYCPLKTRT